MRALLALALLGAALAASSAEPTPGAPVGWRYDGTGVFPDTDPPIEWAPDGKNLLWKMKFDDPYPWGNAQPIAVGKRLFVFHEPTFMACLDADTGCTQWL